MTREWSAEAAADKHSEKVKWERKLYFDKQKLKEADDDTGTT